MDQEIKTLIGLCLQISQLSEWEEFCNDRKKSCPRDLRNSKLERSHPLEVSDIIPF